MKIILKQEVDNLGLPGDIVTVADGYGRNYLIPRGMAILATKGAEREAEALLRARKVREAATLTDARAMAEQMESRVLRISARVDESGTLYGSVGPADVVRVLRERGHKVERKRIDLTSIKEIGEYEVPVQVHPQVAATLTVEVVDETGEVTLESLNAADEPPPPIEPTELDPAQAAAVAEAAQSAAAGSDSDVEALAEQALEAARSFEAEQAARAAAAGDAEDDEAAEDEDEGADATA